MKTLIIATALFVVGFTVGMKAPTLSHLLHLSSESCPVVESGMTKQEAFAALQCAKNAGGYIIAQDVPANASTSIAVGRDTVLISIDGDRVTSMLTTRPLRESDQVRTRWVQTVPGTWTQEFGSVPPKGH